MLKNQDGFHHLVVVLVILVLGTVGFVGFRVIQKAANSNGHSSASNATPEDAGPKYDALPACDGDKPVLTRSPINLSAIDFVSPLGSINPPEHTIPTDHNYFMYYYERDTSERYDIVAPADAVITSLGYSGELQNGEYKNTDFSIILSPCRGLSFRLSHINTLEGILKDEIGLDGKGADCRTDKPTTERELVTCGKNTDISVSGGGLIGKVGAPYVAAWDFWAHKEGYKNPGIIAKDYRYDVDAVCGLDYFVEPIKSQIYAKIKRTGEPQCGDVGQDKKDTLQGSWFAHKDPEKARTDWNSHFTLAYDAGDTGLGVVAVAGKIADPFIYNFAPTHGGVINREPSETTAGTVYCYQHDGERRLPNGTFAGEGKVLLKLVDNHTMQAEHTSGNCGSDETLSSPTTYYR